jgi:uncharacterized sporulation protein YeaH/YhbH (DUF444 family)
MNIVDRRLNPKGKSLANRQRFFRRAKAEITRAVRDASAKRSIEDIAGGDQISIPSDGIKEPHFRRSGEGGKRHHVVPGNKEYVEGDEIPRPPGGAGGRGSQGSPDGEGEDAFRFVLSRDEFLDIFLEDLELPDLVKKKIKMSDAAATARAGFSVSGSPANLNLVRTIRNSLPRRIALKRPKREEAEKLEEEVRRLEAEGGEEARLAELRGKLEGLKRRMVSVPFIDPIDVRYNRFQSVPKPVSQAVMFCLMDVSGSMTEAMKDLAKRFFMLLYLFLQRRYRHVEVVFIRHTHEAREVDEETFFYSRETGGTVVSTALEEMRKVIAARYPVDDWNIYAAQASDGDNTTSDNARTASLLEHSILPVCQYFAYIEVGGDQGDHPSRETQLWRVFKSLATPTRPLAMRRVADRADIFPVFRDLFSRDHTNAA